MLRSSSISAGRDGLSWPVLLLLLAVLAPTGGVVWMMRAAMENERLAVQQRLADAYRVQLESARQLAQEELAAALQRLDDAANGAAPPAAFARCVATNACDSVIVLATASDKGGRRTIAYPTTGTPIGSFDDDLEAAWAAADRLEFTQRSFVAAASAYAAIASDGGDSPRAALALQAEARCLSRLDDRAGASRVLSDLAKRTQATDRSGRSLAADAELRRLELLEPKSPVWNDAFATLSARLANYESPLPPADQRRFLMHRLQELAPDMARFPTLAAEDLAAAVLESNVNRDTSDGHPGLETNGKVATLAAQRFAATGIQDLWAARSPAGRVVALLHEATLADRLQRVLGEQPLPVGVTIAVRRPGDAADVRDGFLAAAIGPMLPGWGLSLAVDDDRLASGAVQGRRAAFAWTAAAVIGVTLTLTWLAASAMRRQARTSRLKNDLVATVSHELKTPLASIRLLVDSLLDAPAGATAAANGHAREYLEMIARENARLTRLIDNFLTFSRLDQGKQRFDVQPIDGADVVRCAVAAVSSRFDGASSRLEVEADGPLLLAGDADALVTAVVNLLDNAWKYTGDDKHVRASAQCVGDFVEITVADNGIGLAPRAVRRVFDRFYQADNRLARTQGGCGLGLSIVRSIVEAHGGTVRVTSRLGVGSEFTISLPAAATGAGDARPHGTAEVHAE